MPTPADGFDKARRAGIVAKRGTQLLNISLEQGLADPGVGQHRREHRVFSHELSGVLDEYTQDCHCFGTERADLAVTPKLLIGQIEMKRAKIERYRSGHRVGLPKIYL